MLLVGKKKAHMDLFLKILVIRTVSHYTELAYLIYQSWLGINFWYF